MADALTVLLTGTALGFSIAAPPGPVTALAVQQVAARSWLAGWMVLLGATASDGVFFVLTYYGVTRIVTAGERSWLFVLGGILMLYLAASILRGARRKGAAPGPAPRRWTSLERIPFLMGLGIGLTNPFQLGWWVAIGAGMVSDFGASIAVGFFIGIVSWTIIVSSLVHAGVRRYERLAPFVAYAAGTIMAAFAVWFLGIGLSSTIL
ncbi:MAG TPA: LysE family transporter [Nitrososphaerales archaeon]|nr:LysE family transporter [Nitrososphaerales archaeon]HUK74614.1 LysE family transporter [Nitrososphaerales archaeon]